MTRRRAFTPADYRAWAEDALRNLRRLNEHASAEDVAVLTDLIVAIETQLERFERAMTENV